MLTAKIEGLERIRSDLFANQKAVEIAAQRAILNTAKVVREAELSEMQRVFDRPTRWTLGSIKVKATSAFEVHVGVLDPDGYYKRAANYLKTQIEGGSRKAKAMEVALQRYGLMPQGWFIVPGAGAQLDAFGNISVGQIRQILSWFGTAERWAGSTQNMTEAGREKRRRGTKKNVGFEYFCVLPGVKNNLKQPGIYKRFYMGHGKSIKPILIYVKESRFKKRFDYEATALKVTDAMLNAEFESCLKRELAR